MPASTIRATTQEHLDIEDITHNLLLLKDGSAAMVLKLSAINFNLLSDQEQDSIIFSYAGLLNSLSFPVQILIRSQKKDISNYIRLVRTQEVKELNPIIKNRITQYREFVEKIVKERNVLDKSFYVIIPFQYLELGAVQGVTSMGKKPSKLPYDKNYIIQKALNSLEPKRDHLMRQFAHLNLSPKQLATQELIQLFYNVYNPDSHEGVALATPTQYQQGLVQSSTQVNPPTPTPTHPQPPAQPDSKAVVANTPPQSTQPSSDSAPQVVYNQPPNQPTAQQSKAINKATPPSP